MSDALYGIRGLDQVAQEDDEGKSQSMTAYRRMPSQVHFTLTEVNDDQHRVEQVSLVSTMYERDELVEDSS